MGEPGSRVETRVIGRYELLLPIARGGMGTVYLARTRGIGGFVREVALKLVHDHLERDSADVNLLAEARIAARLRHPNAVPVLDVGEIDGRPYIVMDYVEGDSLAGLIKRATKMTGERIALAVSLRAILDALAGLHAAHELVAEDGTPLGLVHRDFSPQNVLVGLDGLARLADFGVAKLVTPDSTESGLVKGKVRYMSPEQARGRRLDRRCDVWAAGVMLWEQLARRKLFAADTDAATLLNIVSTRPARLREVVPDIHPALDEVVAGALEPDLELRTPTALALRQGLGRALREAGLAIEQDDVAAVVSRIAGPMLAERRAFVLASARATEMAPPSAGPSLVGDAARLPAPSQPLLVESSSSSRTAVGVAGSIPAGPPEPIPRTPGRATIALVVGCVVMSVIGTWLIVISMSKSQTASASAANLDAGVTTTATPSAEPAPSASASAAPGADTGVKTREVELRSNIPIREVSFLETMVTVNPPKPVVPLTIPATEDVVVVTTIASDGRRKTVTLAANMPVMTVSFPTEARPAGGGRIVVAPPADLAPSPYGKKK